MSPEPSQQELEAAHCWERDDQVPGRPAMTAFRRRARLHQSRWRESKGHPIGTQPIAPRPGAAARPMGSRLPLDYARETGANFVTSGAFAAANARTSIKEPNQSIDHQRLWADLLWSPTVAFNLFGELTADLALADRAVHVWWPDAPGRVSEVRFAHSPGWLDPAYTGNLISFDAAFVLDRGDGTKGIVAVGTKYHERSKRERPKPARLPRYVEVMDESEAFAPGALDAVNGTDLLVMWLEHVLALSMPQHPSGEWSWARYAVVHPSGNTDVVDQCARYGALLRDESTFSPLSLEALLAAGALPAKLEKELRARYVD